MRNHLRLLAMLAAIFFLGWAEGLAGQVDLEAEEWVLGPDRAWLEKVRTDASVCLNVAIKLSEQMKYEAAIAECERIMNTWPDRVGPWGVAFSVKLEAMICLGQAREATSYAAQILEEHKDDRRPVPWAGGRTYPMRLFLEGQSIRVLGIWANEREGNFLEAIGAWDELEEVYRKIAATASENVDIVSYTIGADFPMGRGDLLRHAKSYPEAAKEYRLAMEYIREHTPPGGYDRPLTQKHELPRLIQECQAANSEPGSPLDFRRNVDYVFEIANMYTLCHNFEAAGDCYRSVLRYLSRYSLQGVDDSEMKRYEEIQKRCMELRTYPLLAEVDTRIEHAKEYAVFDKYPQAIWAYEKALGYLKARSLPDWLSADEKEKYTLLITELPKRIEEARAKLELEEQKTLAPLASYSW